MRSTSVTLLFRSISPSSRPSASITTSTWCASTISSAWPTSWVQTRPASPKTRIAFLSRYVPRCWQPVILSDFTHVTACLCRCLLTLIASLLSPLYRAPVQIHGKTLLWTNWVCSARRGAARMTGCPPSHSQSAEGTFPQRCFTLWRWWKESQGAELQLGVSNLTASLVWIMRLLAATSLQEVILPVQSGSALLDYPAWRVQVQRSTVDPGVCGVDRKPDGHCERSWTVLHGALKDGDPVTGLDNRHPGVLWGEGHREIICARDGLMKVWKLDWNSWEGEYGRRWSRRGNLKVWEWTLLFLWVQLSGSSWIEQKLLANPDLHCITETSWTIIFTLANRTMQSESELYCSFYMFVNKLLELNTFSSQNFYFTFYIKCQSFNFRWPTMQQHVESLQQKTCSIRKCCKISY